MISFRIGYADAEILAKDFANTFIPRQFVDLDRYQIFVRLMESGVASTPFPAKTMSPIGMTHSRAQKLVQRSRDKYSLSRKWIEEKLNSWLQN